MQCYYSVLHNGYKTVGRKRPHNRKCELTWDQLTNRNDVVDSVGDGPIETTAESTTKKKKAWESFKSSLLSYSVNIHVTCTKNFHGCFEVGY